MNLNFTDRTLRVLELAREEAGGLRHPYIGTEHVLLGLLREGEGVAVAALLDLGAEPDRVRDALLAALPAGVGGVAGNVAAELPYTSRAQRALDLVIAEAETRKHAYVGTEHLLLGLLREEKNIAAHVLNAHNVTYEAAVAVIDQLLGNSWSMPVDEG